MLKNLNADAETVESKANELFQLYQTETKTPLSKQTFEDRVKALKNSSVNLKAFVIQLYICITFNKSVAKTDKYSGIAKIQDAFNEFFEKALGGSRGII